MKESPRVSRGFVGFTLWGLVRTEGDFADLNDCDVFGGNCAGEGGRCAELEDRSNVGREATFVFAMIAAATAATALVLFGVFGGFASGFAFGGGFKRFGVDLVDAGAFDGHLIGAAGVFGGGCGICLGRFLDVCLREGADESCRDGVPDFLGDVGVGGEGFDHNVVGFFEIKHRIFHLSCGGCPRN